MATTAPRDSDDIAFVDHSPIRNAVYVPADAADARSGGHSSSAHDALLSEAMPTTFFGKVAFQYQLLKAYKDERFKTLKPWTEFFDKTKFSSPGKMEAFSRANKNVSYFYSNYVVLATVSSLYVLLINPSFLVSLFAALALYYILRTKSNAGEPLVLLGKEFSYPQAWTFLVIFSILSFYFTGGSSTVFWLVLSSVGIVMAHAMFREPPLDAGSPLGFASYV